MSERDQGGRIELTPDQAFAQAVGLHNQGRLADAETLYNAVLKLVPAHAGALHHLGLLAFQTGNGAAALQLVDQALKAQPGYAEAWCNRGVILAASGNSKQAEQAYRKAIALSPDYADAWANLSGLLVDFGQPEDGLQAAEKAVALDPAQADGWNNLATARLDCGDAAGAIAAAEQALALRPDNAHYHYNIANAQKKLRRNAAAIASYQQAIRLAPDLPHPYNNLAGLLLSLGAVEEGLRFARLAAERAPNDGRVQTTLANALRNTNQATEAERVYREAVALKPDHAEAWNNLGGTLNALGRFAEAEAAFRRAIALNPHYVEAHRHLSIGKQFSSVDDPDFKALRALAPLLDTLEDKPAGRLHFALAKAWADIGDTDTAFSHYRQGGACMRAGLVGDLPTEEMQARLQGFTEAMKTAFDADWAARRGALASGGAAVPADAQPSDAPRPIFILGMPRSGTTLTEQILGSHSAVTPGGELNFLTRALREGLAQQVPGARDVTRELAPPQLAGLSGDGLQAIGEVYRQWLKGIDGAAAFVTDKMPGNYRWIGLIAAIWPDARIIHCVRDPRDVCLSCFTTCFSTGHEWSYDLAELGHAYRAYAALMAHWHALLPGRIHDVSYADLVREPEAEIHKLLDYCGLPWEARCLDFHTHPRAVFTASVRQVRQPLYDSSLGRWRAYADHLAPLFAALGPLLPPE
ncbi:MAG TPA: hypothetical protein DIT40_12280 [Alphaproteobacteria bacterium]|nr:hypothetical protein [Alphaproteobacteria bacterium]